MTMTTVVRQKELYRLKKLETDINRLKKDNGDAHSLALRGAIEDIENASEQQRYKETHSGLLIDGLEVTLNVYFQNVGIPEAQYGIYIEIIAPPEKRLFDIEFDKRISDFFKKDIHFKPIPFRYKNVHKKPRTTELDRFYTLPTERGYSLIAASKGGIPGESSDRKIMFIHPEDKKNIVRLYLTNFVYEHPQILELVDRFLKEGIGLEHLDNKPYLPSIS